MVRVALVAATALCALAQPADARVNLTVDRATITADEHVTATFTVEGDTAGEPDFSPIERNFDIVRRQSHSSMSALDRRPVVKESWVLTLAPKRQGIVPIPAIAFDGERSLPVPIRVLPAADGGSAHPDIFIQIEGTPQPAYVQAQVVYTVRLYLTRPVSNATLSEPTVSQGDAVIEQIGDGRTYEETRGGQSLTVVERRYAIFPQRSGTLTVDPLVFNGELRNRNVFAPPQLRNARSESFELDVLPVPAEAAGDHWIPASGIALIEEWPQEPPVFRAGEPVTRSLRVVARGLTSAQLPPLLADPPQGFRQYPDQPQLENTIDAAGLTGKRLERVALLATRPGPYVLPAVELRWWSTVEDRMKTARLPERAIEVLPAADPSLVSLPPLSEPDGSVSVPAVSGSLPVAVSSRALALHAGDPMLWIYATLVSLLAWAATLALWWRQRRAARRGSGASTRGAGATPRLRDARQRVRLACAAQDAVAARAAVLSWGACVWPESPPHNLTDLGRRCAEPFASELHALDRALYARDAPAWHGDRLAAALPGIAPPAQAAASSADPLAPLTPRTH